MAKGELLVTKTFTKDQDVEHSPMLVEGAPEQVLPAIDGDHHIIEVPFVSGSGRRRWIRLAKF